MNTYRVKIYAKTDDGAEVYSARTISAKDIDEAKTISENFFQEYDASAKSSQSKHEAMFFEIFAEDEILYASDPRLSVMYGG